MNAAAMQHRHFQLSKSLQGLLSLYDEENTYMQSARKNPTAK